ncbi:hypothetical protein [Sodalis praecaptivus]|uniref:hypothetical protein n=1 Tax=Sodalis praecaptivus TaxID=1239307 RepID=UPI00046CA7E7|nr:hypothetical protein [Sodalis praecaptivus]
MTNETLKEFIERQINTAAQRIIDKGNKLDEVSSGKVDFFIALRSALNGDLDKRELGLLNAINDTLQHLQLIDSKKTFYK